MASRIVNETVEKIISSYQWMSKEGESINNFKSLVTEHVERLERQLVKACADLPRATAEAGLTVESVLAELREMFGRHVEVTIIDCNAPGCKAYRYQIEVQHLQLKIHGASVNEAMDQVRAWSRSRAQKEGEGRDRNS